MTDDELLHQIDAKCDLVLRLLSGEKETCPVCRGSGCYASVNRGMFMACCCPKCKGSGIIKQHSNIESGGTIS